jgi:hypothetical protein
MIGSHTSGSTGFVVGMPVRGKSAESLPHQLALLNRLCLGRSRARACAAVDRRAHLARMGLPRCPENHGPCRSPYPGGLGRVHLSVASAADASLPRYSGGPVATSSLSRPAHDSLALRPARSQPPRAGGLSPHLRLATCRILTVDHNYLSGSLVHWCSAPSLPTE